MSLVRITDLVIKLGMTSRSLRYYEQVGLIESVRRGSGEYRYYDEANVDRLKQIIVLRKMEIPIKDILRIYTSADMSVVVETFVNRIRDIDAEVDALTKLRAVVNDFLQTMLENGVTKIAALPILYEKMEKRLAALEKNRTMSYGNLSALSDKLAEPVKPAIIELPPMRVLSSGANTDGFWRYVQSKNIAPGRPGHHEQFELQGEILLRIPDNFVNDNTYHERFFDGGLYAASNVYLDEDLGQRFRALVSGFDDNKLFEIDYERESMLENLLSPEEKRELVSLLVPVKKRLADPALFGVGEQETSLSVAEIEAANPVLWETDVPMDKLTPDPEWAWCYRVNEQGEGRYCPIGDTHWLSTEVSVKLPFRVDGDTHWLSTGVSVKLPFRVDIEFLLDDSTAAYGYGADEGNIAFFHGANFYGINKGNFASERDEAISFDQPIFANRYHLSKIGRFEPNVTNRLAWIVGEKHLAIIINGELRYCGVNLPYMAADWHGQEAKTVLLTANGSSTFYLKSVRVSQLAQTLKTKIKEGELSMITKPSNNRIPHIRRFINSEHGENYWFNGAARFVMGCLNEPDYGYEFFAGLSGDVFAQVYPYGAFRGDGVTDYFLSDGQFSFIEGIFAKCGYAATFVPGKQLRANREMYLQTLIVYIDKGVPVVAYQFGLKYRMWAVIVGYEEYGKTLLIMSDNMEEPERVSLDAVFDKETDPNWGWVFMGEKLEQKELRQIYRDAIKALPSILTVKTDSYCFGAEAFRAWAEDIEGGKFVNVKLEDFCAWFMHTTYVCNLATNSSCCYAFLDKAMELNADFSFLKDVGGQYRKMAKMWNNDNGEDLEALGGGFNVTLEALQDKEKRGKIAAKLRKFAVCVDEVVRIIKEGIAITQDS
jgi:DNA-binding transcriptional MerR regulator